MCFEAELWKRYRTGTREWDNLWDNYRSVGGNVETCKFSLFLGLRVDIRKRRQASARLGRYYCDVVSREWKEMKKTRLDQKLEWL